MICSIVSPVQKSNQLHRDTLPLRDPTPQISSPYDSLTHTPTHHTHNRAHHLPPRYKKNTRPHLQNPRTRKHAPPLPPRLPHTDDGLSLISPPALPPPETLRPPTERPPRAKRAPANASGRALGPRRQRVQPGRDSRVAGGCGGRIATGLSGWVRVCACAAKGKSVGHLGTRGY